MNARSDSLLRKLQEAKNAQGELRGLHNELMIFLEDPPPLTADDETADRWQRGADLVNSWGFKCGRSAVYSLHKSYALYWRMQVANGAVHTTDSVSSFEGKIKLLSAQRSFEALADPALDPKITVQLAKIEFQKEALQHDKEKLKASLRTKLETAMEALKAEIESNPAALAAFNAMTAALAPKQA